MATFQDTFDNNDNISLHEGTQTSGGVLRNVVDDNVARASSTDLLSSVSSLAVNDYKYTLAQKSGGREVRVQFSDDNFTTITNSSGDDLLNSGGYTFVSPQYLQGLVSDYRIGDSSGTITAWMRADVTSGGFQTIFSSADNATNVSFLALGWDAFFQALQIVVQDGTSNTFRSPDGSIVLDSLYHVAVTSDSSTLRLYINGQEQVLTTVGGTNSGQWFSGLSNRDDVEIGRTGRNAAFGFFRGVIDDVRVYSQTLTQAQLYDLYSTHVSAFTPVSHWLLNGNTDDSGSEGADMDNVETGTSETDFNLVANFGEALGDQNTLDFDDSTGRVNLGSDASLDNLWIGGGTASFWIFPRGAGGDGTGVVVTKRPEFTTSGWAVTAKNAASGNIRLEFLDHYSGTDGVYQTDVIVPLGKWSHFAVTMNGSLTTAPIFYLNGASTTVNTIAAHTGTYDSDAAQDLLAGAARFVPVAKGWDGYIANIALFSDILSAGDIATEYENGFIDLDHADYIDSWSFAEGTGTPVSEQGLSTTLEGTTWIETITRPGVGVPAQQTIDISGLSFTSSVYVRTIILSAQDITPNSFTSQEEITIDFDEPATATNLTLLGVGP